jgi:hypothetical protein
VSSAAARPAVRLAPRVFVPFPTGLSSTPINHLAALERREDAENETLKTYR